MGSHLVTTAVNNCIMCTITFHKDLPLPLMVHYEVPVNAFYGPGASAHALTDKVLHRGFRIAKDGHDCGPNIAHLPLSIINMLLPLHILKSERKVLFSASTVLMESVPTACSNMWPYTPMLACSDPFPAPNCVPIDNDINSVLVGMTWRDWAAGLAVFAIQVAVGVADVMTAGRGSAAPALADFVSDFAKDQLGVDVGGSMGKLGVSQLTGLTKMLLTGHGAVELGAGTRALGGKVSIKRNAKTGELEVETEGEVWGDKHGWNGGNKATKKETDTTTDGTVLTATATTETHADGSQTETVTEKSYDQQGRETSSTTTTQKRDANGAADGPAKTRTNPLPQNVTADNLRGEEDELL